MKIGSCNFSRQLGWCKHWLELIRSYLLPLLWSCLKIVSPSPGLELFCVISATLSVLFALSKVSLWTKPLPYCLASSSVLLLSSAHFTLLYIFSSRKLLGHCSKINSFSFWLSHLSTFLFKAHPLLHFLLQVHLFCRDAQVIHSKVLSGTHVSFWEATFFQYCYFEYKMYWELYDMLGVCQSKVKSTVRLGGDGTHL